MKPQKVYLAELWPAGARILLPGKNTTQIDKIKAKKYSKAREDLLKPPSGETPFFTIAAIAFTAFRMFMPTAFITAAGEPKYRQVYRWLAQLINDGTFSPGFRLPATRDLARRLGVTRQTVMTAYEELEADVKVESHVGSGTYMMGSS